MSTLLIYRIHPQWAEDVNKTERHNRLLGTVIANSPEDAIRKAGENLWKLQTETGKAYTGEYRAVV